MIVNSQNIFSVISRDDEQNDDLRAQRKIAGYQEMEEEGIVNRLQRQIETLLAKYKARHTIRGMLLCLPGCSRGSRHATFAACVVAKALPRWILENVHTSAVELHES